jgi:hypothetical protein
MLTSRRSDNPSGHSNRHAERAGGSSHASIERHENRIYPPGDGDVQRIGRQQRQIKPPHIGCGSSHITSVEFGSLG